MIWDYLGVISTIVGLVSWLMWLHTHDIGENPEYLEMERQAKEAGH
jgi:hypothetical protein